MWLWRKAEKSFHLPFKTEKRKCWNHNHKSSCSGGETGSFIWPLKSNYQSLCRCMIAEEWKCVWSLPIAMKTILFPLRIIHKKQPSASIKYICAEYQILNSQLRPLFIWLPAMNACLKAIFQFPSGDDERNFFNHTSERAFHLLIWSEINIYKILAWNHRKCN